MEPVPDRDMDEVTTDFYGLADANENDQALCGRRADHELSKTDPGPNPSEELDHFYRELFHELAEFIRRPGATAAGAAVVAKRVALAHGLPIAQYLPLPRLTRAEYEERQPWDGA